MEIEPGVFLDARRAVWFAREGALAVADLHLGFAWGSRVAGNLFPVETPDDTVERLCDLAREYDAGQVLVLGDIVHRAESLRQIGEELIKLHRGLGRTALHLLSGNHDRGLQALLEESRLAVKLNAHARLGEHALLHGDASIPEAQASAAGRIFIGHEHPAIRLGDGIAGMKCPCFLLGSRVVVLPAFSAWAAGTEVRGATFLSPIARAERFQCAVAILAGKLLPVPLGAGNIPRS